MNRRQLLKQGGAATTLLKLNLAGRAAAQGSASQNDRKSLVCIYFSGGLDSFHVLVPRDDNRWQEYKDSRTNIAHAQNRLLPLSEIGGSSSGELYGLHPQCSKLADMFNGTGSFTSGRRASWLSNVGTLIKPLTMDEYRTGRAGLDVPIGIAGHVRQAEQWQTTLPQGTVNLRGWMGRTADLLGGSFNRDGASMNLSLAGNNTLQLGEETRPFSFNPFLELGLSGRSVSDVENPLAIKNLLHRRLLDQRYQQNYAEETFADISLSSLQRQQGIQTALESFPTSQLPVKFSRGSFHKDLEAVVKLIATRESQGLSRQTFFVQAPGGWDDHFVLGQGFDDRIKEVSDALAIFQQNLDQLGLAESVVGFTTSEFARTLRSTSFGSDHAWGGPQMVFGEPIDSGKIFGRFPSLALDSEDDIGRGGRLLPDRGCDEYFADLLRWFGVDDDQLDIALPNYGNFTSVAGRDPIGFIRS